MPTEGCSPQQDGFPKGIYFCILFTAELPLTLHLNSQAEDELYIVMELLESDLHRIIQSKQVRQIDVCDALVVTGNTLEWEKKKEREMSEAHGCLVTVMLSVCMDAP